MEPVSAPAARAPEGPGQPARQRWRLVLARSAGAPRIGGRELADLWETAIDSTGLPFHLPAGRSRPRLAFGAPLQLGIAAEQELADLLLAELLPIWQVRGALAAIVPDGWSLVELYDVWVGGPPLAGQVAAAEYRIELGDETDRAAIAAAARHLLAARQLPRVRRKGDGSVTYDLRPLLADLAVDQDGPRASLRIRTRMHPALGTGRPEEVVAALGDRVGRLLEVRAIVRERLILADAPG